MAPRDKQQQELYIRSGQCELTTMLESFLYTLMRDHVSPGTVEGLLRDAKPCNCTNGYLGAYARDVAERLTKERHKSRVCAKPEALVERWNKKYPVGTLVDVEKNDGTILRTETVTPAWLVGDRTAGILIVGEADVYDLNRVKPVK